VITIAELDVMIDTLKRAIYTGAARVEYPNQGAVTYRNSADMKAALGDMEAERAALQTTGIAVIGGGRRWFRCVATKGL